MKRIIYVITTIITICLIIYCVLFKTYTINRAIKNGDFITGAETINYYKFEKFMDDMKNGSASSITIIVYSKEGKPVIHDLNYRDSIIFCETDETKTHILKFFKNEVEEYTNIILKDFGFAKEYYIINDNSEKYLFQVNK